MRFSVRKLSTRRRHPLAGIVVLLVALGIVGGAYSALAPEPAKAETASTQDVEAGRQLFLIGCASCHGKNASGIETKRGGNYGPSLIGVGAASVDFQVGTGRMPLAKTAPQAPKKVRPEYDEEEVRQLAAYIASLAPGPAIPDDEYTDISGKTVEQIREGGEFFRTNCTACHNSVGAGGALPGGKYAPALDGVSATHIAEAMITGPQQMPVFSDEVITPEDKSNIIAYIKQVQTQPNYGGVAGGGLGPVSEGLFTWIIGIGGLLIAAIWIGAHGARVKKR
jgi:ubiquinol-cytochrome c reductase cytochrome c subunit